MTGRSREEGVPGRGVLLQAEKCSYRNGSLAPMSTAASRETHGAGSPGETHGGRSARPGRVQAGPSAVCGGRPSRGRRMLFLPARCGALSPPQLRGSISAQVCCGQCCGLRCGQCPGCAAGSAPRCVAGCAPGCAADSAPRCAAGSVAGSAVRLCSRAALMVGTDPAVSEVPADVGAVLPRKSAGPQAISRPGAFDRSTRHWSRSCHERLLQGGEANPLGGSRRGDVQSDSSHPPRIRIDPIRKQSHFPCEPATSAFSWSSNIFVFIR
ncbi:MAG: hypothetical protein QG608_2605 [Actinomycetota bacterium]|nr:hypothetical protein [Actinomycetota bacterium]